MPNQRTPGRTVVQPNTLSGQTRPNTLSTMPGRGAEARQSGWAAASGRSQPAPPRAATAGRSALGGILRVVVWVVFVAIFLILSQAQR